MRILLVFLLVAGTAVLADYLAGDAEPPELWQIREEHCRILEAYSDGDMATAERLLDRHADRWWADRSPYAGKSVEVKDLRDPVENWPFAGFTPRLSRT